MALNKKHKGSTLVEVLVALAITSFCATLAVIIYLNIQQSTLPFTRIKASELADKYLNEAISKKDYFDNQYTEEEYIIKKVIVRNTVYTDCRDLTISVFDINNKRLAWLQTTLYAE
jgi:prepilin-type N-terminal cleavage/methylation domain-containing protein